MRLLLAVLLSAAPVPTKTAAAPVPRNTLAVRPVSKTLVADLAHGKPLVLHFFASWCGACRDEFPRLKPHLRKLSSEGVALQLIAIDRPGDREKAEAMLREYGLSSLPSFLLDAPDPEPVAKAVGQPKWDGTLPATFVYDSGGKLQKSFIGIAAPAKFEAAVRQVTR